MIEGCTLSVLGVVQSSRCDAQSQVLHTGKHDPALSHQQQSQQPQRTTAGLYGRLGGLSASSGLAAASLRQYREAASANSVLTAAFRTSSATTPAAPTPSVTSINDSAFYFHDGSGYRTTPVPVTPMTTNYYEKCAIWSRTDCSQIKRFVLHSSPKHTARSPMSVSAVWSQRLWRTWLINSAYLLLSEHFNCTSQKFRIHFKVLVPQNLFFPIKISLYNTKTMLEFQRAVTSVTLGCLFITLRSECSSYFTAVMWTLGYKMCSCAAYNYCRCQSELLGYGQSTLEMVDSEGPTEGQHITHALWHRSEAAPYCHWRVTWSSIHGGPKTGLFLYCWHWKAFHYQTV